MKQIILLITALVLVATSCQKEKQVSNTATLEVFADSLFQASIDSAQIAGTAILCIKTEKIFSKIIN
jgi:uncharacterized protein YcfL